MLSTNGKSKEGDIIKCVNGSTPSTKLNELAICVFPQSKSHVEWEVQHLYILSDDEIKKGDWVMDNRKSCVNMIHQISCHVSGNVNKIIASTNSMANELSIEGNIGNMPSIPQSFIDKYVSEYNKGNKIQEAMVEYEYVKSMDMDDPDLNDYIYDRLKLNPDNTINIKSVKDSWTREEMIKVCKEVMRVSSYTSTFDFDEWIESNL